MRTAKPGRTPPGIAASWQWQLSGQVNSGYDVDVYGIDLKDSPISLIADWHSAGHFDFAVNEQRHQFDECDTYAPFLNAEKPVFNAEYLARYVNDAGQREGLCAEARAQPFRTLILLIELNDSFRFSCD